MKTLPIKKLYIDRQVVGSPLVADIRSRLKVPFEIVENARRVYESVNDADDPVAAGKTTLFLTRNPASFIKGCPGTRKYTCCGYKILHVGTYCCLDCSYCILQSYFHPPVLQFFVNHERLLAELELLFSRKKITRIGTGEFTDSMIWEELTGLSNLLVKHFSSQHYAVLELKTKTTAIDGLKNIRHNRKTIVSWSLNTDRVILEEERQTAGLSQRLRAAAKCNDWGYPLAFHFDPLIIYEGCENDYRRVVEALFKHIPADNVAWISLGSFRFMPSLKPIVQRRFPQSKIVYGEFIPGLDGKMRYFKPLRIELYRKMTGWIRESAPNVTVYFCMEDDEVWKKALGFVPVERGGLPRMLDESAAEICGLRKNGP